MAVLAVEGLCKRYPRGVQALDDVTLAVEPGEAFGLLGPNGAGKTTLVKILLGLRRATAGRATILGRPAGEAAARQEVGYLPEDHRLPPYLTGRRALQVYCLLQGLSPRSLRPRIDELLERLGLAERAGEKIRHYSKGMKQRLGLAQALLHRPKLVLLDEPTDGVDPTGRAVIRDCVREERRQGMTVFVNSHLLDEVERTCERVAILRRGKLLQQGPIAELLREGERRRFRLVLDRAAPELATLLPPGALPVESDGAQHVLELEQEALLDPLVDALRGAGCGIRAIVPLQRTLEQHFVEVTGDDHAT